MKPKANLSAVIAAAVVFGGSAGFAYDRDAGAPSATVEFIEPEHFTDFSLTQLGGKKEQAALAAELRAEIERSARRHLPPGYHLGLRFRDIDMAGEFEPFQIGTLSDTRIVRSSYLPRMRVEYTVTDPNGQVVASGERNLVDPTFEFRLLMPQTSDVRYEAALLDDFIREVARSIS